MSLAPVHDQGYYHYASVVVATMQCFKQFETKSYELVIVSVDLFMLIRQALASYYFMSCGLTEIEYHDKYNNITRADVTQKVIVVHGGSCT